jgi:hypothetical protein
VPAWANREQWLALVDARIQSTDGAAIRSLFAGSRTASVRTLLEVSRVLADAADYATGRNVTVTNATICAAVGRSERTVRRACRILEALGLAEVIVEGRELTRDERAEARRLHGGAQTGAGSVRAMTVPREVAALSFGPLPTHTPVSKTSHLLKNSSRRARARSTAASRPMQGRNPHPKQTRRPEPIRTMGFKRFAAQLDAVDVKSAGDRVVGRFTQGRSIVHLYRILEAAHLNESMNPTDVLSALRYRPGMPLRDGLAWLRGHEWVKALTSFYRGRGNISQSPVPTPPPAPTGQFLNVETDEMKRARWAREKAAADERRAAQAEELAASRALREKVQAEKSEISAIIEQMRRQYPTASSRTARSAGSRT